MPGSHGQRVRFAAFEGLGDPFRRKHESERGLEQVGELVVERGTWLAAVVLVDMRLRWQSDLSERRKLCICSAFLGLSLPLLAGHVAVGVMWTPDAEMMDQKTERLLANARARSA